MSEGQSTIDKLFKDQATIDRLVASGQHLLEAYKECGEHMRFYSDTRFKIMTLALTLAGALVSVQQVFAESALVFDLIGLLSTIALFSLEYRYSQAWVSLLHWAERNVEDKLFGDGGGPLNSYRDIPHPWYIVKSKPATNILYLLLLLVWTGSTIWHSYLLIIRLP